MYSHIFSIFSFSIYTTNFFKKWAKPELDITPAVIASLLTLIYHFSILYTEDNEKLKPRTMKEKAIEDIFTTLKDLIDDLRKMKEKKKSEK